MGERKKNQAKQAIRALRREQNPDQEESEEEKDGANDEDLKDEGAAEQNGDAEEEEAGERRKGRRGMDWSENVLVDLKKEEVFAQLDKKKEELKGNTGAG